MFRPRVIPVLLLKGNGLVKTIKFNKRKSIYLGDPINAVRIFNDLSADELVFLDITATIENRCIDFDIVNKIGDEAYMPIAVGGGITTIDQIRQILMAGAEKVIINTAGIKQPAFIEKASSQFGSQSIIASIDIGKDLWGNKIVVINGGEIRTKIRPVEAAKTLENAGAGEILINVIDRDGMMQGYDLESIKEICEIVKVPVIACGGAGSYHHLREGIEEAKASAVASGSMFVFHGPRKAVLINYPDKAELNNLFN